MTFIFPTLLTLALSVTAFSSAHAGWTEQLPTDEGVTVTLTSPFNQLPSVGYLPINATIVNDSERPLTYDVLATTTSGYGTNQTATSTSQQLTIPPNQSLTAPLLVPIAPTDATTGQYRQTQVTVVGPGIRENGMTQYPNVGSNSGNVTAFTALSDDLALRSWGPLSEQAEKNNRPLAGTRFTPLDLPDDWLGLSGIASLWITANELDSLTPAQRTAVDNWIRQGGHLFWVLEENSNRTVAEFADSGLGTVSLRRWNGTELPTAETLADITKEPSANRSLTQDYTSGWKLADLVGQLRLPVTLLVAFIILFAVIVGPINLFVFARAGRRQRLFWTTPLISIVASLLLGIIIWFQDGSGGDGQRMVLGVLSPGTNQLLIRQEQISRSGLLLDRDFTLAEDALIARISLTSDPNLETARRFEQTGKNVAGQWFNSRAVQAQYLESIVPSRARIELVDTQSDGTPTLLSSVPFTLEKILFTDNSGTTWQGGPLRTGEKIPLTRATRKQADDLLRSPTKSAGPLIAQAWTSSQGKSNTFHALSEPGPYLETLDSIRWTNHQSLLTGPVE